MNVGTIAGGTRAGWRRVKQAHPLWKCACNYLPGGELWHPGWRGKCSDCGAARPT